MKTNHHTPVLFTKSFASDFLFTGCGPGGQAYPAPGALWPLALVLLFLSGCAGETDDYFSNLETNPEALSGQREAEREGSAEPSPASDPASALGEAGEELQGESPENHSTSNAPICPDPAVLVTHEPCCDAGDGYCLPMDAVPTGLQSDLDTCGDAGACVPGIILDSLAESGSYAPKVCESLGAKDGVCLSVCIPKVRDVMALLPQDICGPNERCTPCIDPITGLETGACTGGLTCDEQGVEEPEGNPTGTGDETEHESTPPEPTYSCENPPDEPLVDLEAFSPCCDGAHCVPKNLVPEEEHEMLATCDGDSGFCVPDPMVESGGFFVPQTCESIGGLEGRCLSTCLPNVAAKAESLPVDICGAKERCAPCCDPFTGESTDACDRGCDIGPEEGMCTGPIYATCCNGIGHCIEPELIPEEKSGNVQKCTGEESGMVCVPDAMQDPDYAGEPCLGKGLLASYEGVCLPDCLKIFLKFALDDATCAPHHKCVPCVGPFGKATGAPGCVQ